MVLSFTHSSLIVTSGSSLQIFQVACPANCCRDSVDSSADIICPCEISYARTKCRYSSVIRNGGIAIVYNKPNIQNMIKNICSVFRLFLSSFILSLYSLHCSISGFCCHHFQSANASLLKIEI